MSLVSGVRAEVCGKCGERYFDLAAMRRLEARVPRCRKTDRYDGTTRAPRAR
ncbi:MAG: YgiT-type zinc finger protein [Planctomycetes bacterium]|nr:YgiT-type zinc finger protein [Planctomycetota bacterium]MBI3847266.1 YgiT-type zinc finger protein [Planctomycetota bacterium]